jgi:LPS sulfotransferase NodH
MFRIFRSKKPHDTSPSYLERKEPENWSTSSYDRPFEGDPASIQKYIVCSTPRSGSWLLCRQLFRAGLGVPHEYFNHLFIDPFSERYGITAEEDYLPTLLARRTTANGIWGGKLHWNQYKDLSASLRIELFRGARTIYIKRGNVLDQAVSLYISQQTRVWVGDLTDDDLVNLPANFYEDSVDTIQQNIKKLHYGNLQWQHFFFLNQIKPFFVLFEHLVREQTQVVSQVCQHIGVGLEDIDLPEPEPKPQSTRADTVKQKLKARYIESYPDDLLKL